jgi:hypothetical protein
MHTLRIATISTLSLLIGVSALVGGFYIASAAFTGPTAPPPGGSGFIQATSTGNIGIGTAPVAGYKMSVSGNVNLVSSSKIQFSSDPTDKIYYYGQNYGTGIEAWTLTNWSARDFRWQAGGTSAGGNTTKMLLSNLAPSSGLTVYYDNTTVNTPGIAIDAIGAGNQQSVLGLRTNGVLRGNIRADNSGNLVLGSTGSGGIYLGTPDGSYKMFIKSDGHIGIGPNHLSPTYDLDLNPGAILIRTQGVAPRGTEAVQEGIRMTGSTSDYITAIQDGTGRVLQYWNSSAGAPTYLVSGEVAVKTMISNGGSNPIYSISQAPAGTAGGAITWSETFRIDDEGTIKIGSLTGDPATSVGGGSMYYNSVTFKFRCLQGSPLAWTDCAGSATYQ